MAREFTPKVVTANDLLDGDCVWLTATGGWSQNLADAFVARSDDEAEEALARASAQADRIVGAYLADVEIGDGGVPQPVHFREIFRTRGPSNRFHGKQAEA